MSRAQKDARRIKLIDPSTCGGELHACHDDRGKMTVVAATWVDNDYIVTIPMHVPHWRKWSRENMSHSRQKRLWRRTTYNACVAALKKCGYDLSWDPRFGRFERLHANLDAVGFVLITPAAEDVDDDSYIHTLHHVRDGGYDCWGGFVMSKPKPRPARDRNGRLILDRAGEQRMVTGNPQQVWRGQYLDNKKNKLYVPPQYNILQEGEAHGVRVVFRFKSGMKYRSN